ncbi:uncharacterized protein LOC133189369 [Saccostrea echinata]|uniref:uncharacterized protein LOC133189369 n=1 Tax=Saccostrea echinata TaxID=191078 RepID=UPI002A81D288|nr:uncharacterized protein LOC133189369 [Saccostrea echinata]
MESKHVRDKKGRFTSTGKFQWYEKFIEKVRIPSSENEEEICEDWGDGQRIVELRYLSEQLKSCPNCSTPLHLHFCKKERIYGLGSILYIECEMCQKVVKIYTGKEHRSSGTVKGMKIWDVNTKCGLAMDHAGLGPYQVSNFLTALNSPSIHPSTLRARENEIGATLRNYSNESCDEALLEEANLTSKSREDPDDEDDTSPINISFDAAWQKRGSGRSYNSHSATATMIGVETGKIVAFDHKTTDCRKCLFTQTHDHECNKNFNGSSKAMESALAIDMAKSLKDRGFNISKITMDDDSTTISRMKKTVDPNIRKLSDKNHVRKNISNALYKLQEKHKSLSTKTINYLLKDVSYAISQNKGNPEGLQSSIRAIVPHSFGDHSHCDSHWCGYLKDPSNYKHSSLPYGKDLLGDNLKRDSVSQKYISQVHNRHGLSPGKFTIRHNEKMDKKRKAEKNREQTKKAKRRRLMRKSVQIKSTKSKEIREGVQYSPSVDLIVTDIDSIQTIPDKMEPPTQTCIDFESAKNADVVVFDLETTGFAQEHEENGENRLACLSDMRDIHRNRQYHSNGEKQK